VLVIVGGVVISLCFMNIFEQLKVALELTIIFAAPFWVGMFWRRATRLAAWLTIAFSTVAFFLLPATLTLIIPSLAENPRFTVTNDIVTTVTTRPAAPADVARREAEIGLWDARVNEWAGAQRPQGDEAIEAKFGPRPQPIAVGELMEDRFTTGGKPVFFKNRIEVLGDDGKWRPPGPEHLVEISRKRTGNTVVIRQQYRREFRYCGRGRFNLSFLVYDRMGVPLKTLSNAALETLRLPALLVLPFVVIILLSLVTPPGDKAALDRYYVKMKTPVDPDLATDAAELELSYRDPTRFDHRRLFPFWGLEIQQPKLLDIIGFLAAFAICFAIIGLTVWLANLGS
jgi:SSS family solute:Na+ symporter